MSQEQLNAVFDFLIASGAMSKEEFDSPFGKSKVITRPSAIPPTFYPVYLCNLGSAHRLLGQLSFSCAMAIVKLLAAVRTNIMAGDLLVPLVCLRGVLEHVAKYNELLFKLSIAAVPDSLEEAFRILMEVHSKAFKIGYATRVDWNVLSGPNADQSIEQTKIDYQPQPNRADHKASPILTALNLLDKTVSGTRSVYNVLCEFAHPNVGALFLFTEQIDVQTDKQGVRWVKKRFGQGVPTEFIKSTRTACRRILQHTDQCLGHFEKLLDQGESERQKVLKITQVVIRHIMKNNEDLYGLYSLCPCGSDKKLKFCCAK